MERDAQKDERLQHSNVRVKSVECEQKLKIRVVYIQKSTVGQHWQYIVAVISKIC